jgi:hypothetical protein
MIDNDDDDDELVPPVLIEVTKQMHPKYNLPVFLISRLWKPQREVEDFAEMEEASE